MGTRYAYSQLGNVGIDASTPLGANDISIDYTTRVLTITPPLGYLIFYVDGSGTLTKYKKVGNIVFTAFNDTNGTKYFYFDVSGNPITSETVWTDFDIIVPIYRIYWNSTKTGADKSISEGVEFHLNTISSSDHRWKHQLGSIWNYGLSLVSTATTGTPNASGVNTCVSLTTGSIIDDNLISIITNSAGGLKFQQVMGETTAANITVSNSGLFTIARLSGGLGENIAATRFPFSYNAGTNIPNYIIADGTLTPVTNNYFFVYFLYAFQDPRNGQAIRLVSAPAEYANITDARVPTWSIIQTTYAGLNDKEVRPLYKLIFQYKNSYNVAVQQTSLYEIQDIRTTQYHILRD